MNEVFGMASDRAARRSIHYDLNSVVHVEAGGNSTAFTEHGERTTMLCGANLSGSGLDLNGNRLSDEYDRGKMCTECLNALRDRNATIPGFLREGKLLKLHYSEPGTERSDAESGGIEE